MAVVSGSDMLRNAAKVIEDRHKTYGPPNRNFSNIAELWSAWYGMHTPSTDAAFNSADVAVMMVLVKIARLAETSDHLDSWTDIAGYAACGVEVACRQAEPMPDIDRSPSEHWHNGVPLKPEPLPKNLAEAVASTVEYWQPRIERELHDPEILAAMAKPNPSMPLVSEDASEDDFNR